MSRASVFVSRVFGLFGRRRHERDLEDELRFHVQMQTEDNLHAGMSAEAARNAALRSFGGVEPLKERYRDQRGFLLVETLGQDLRYAARTLRKSAAFTVTAVTVLAIAIGANTAMFSVLNAVLLRPLPFREPAQLAMLWAENPGQSIREGRSALRDIEQWQGQSKAFAGMAVIDPASVTLTNAAHTEQIGIDRVSPNFFSLLGVEPVYGRTFTAKEAAERQRVVLISHRFWQARFGGAPDAIGSFLELDGSPSRIIGILPPDSQISPLSADLCEPYTLFPDWERRRGPLGPADWIVVGRLQRGVSFDAAQAEMTTIARRLSEQAPASSRGQGISVVPLIHQIVGARPRLALWMLAGAIFCVLLIAATNVASLSLARSAGREREIAIRAALGASRSRIVRQLLAESLTLAALAGSLGILIAQVAIRLVLVMKPAGLARLNQVALDPRVLAWAAGICLFTGILVGLAPALTLARRNLKPGGQEGGRSIAGGTGTRRARRLLVVSEIALAVMLLTGAGLLVRSLWSIQHVAPGFRPDRVLSMQLASPAYAAASQRTDFFRRVLEQVETQPGVESAAIIGDLFIGGNPERDVTLEDRSDNPTERLRLRIDEISPEFFRTLETPLLRGRFFSSTDGPNAPRVAIVNQAMVRRLWPSRDPLGRRFKIGLRSAPGGWYTVVGVVADMHRQGPEQEPIPQLFEPLAQNPSRLVTLLVRTRNQDPLQMAGALQAVAGSVDKHAPVYGINTLENRLDAYLAERRLQTSLLIAFSLAAMLMAAIGIYGLIQYSVAARTREIGIRVAIGAQAGEIFRMIVGEGLGLSLIGLALGLAGALWLGRAGASLLFGVAANDPFTLAGVSLLLVSVATAACYFPARRAMKLDPITALRQD